MKRQLTKNQVYQLCCDIASEVESKAADLTRMRNLLQHIPEDSESATYLVELDDDPASVTLLTQTRKGVIL